jgi:hypothetical protein
MVLTFMIFVTHMYTWYMHKSFMSDFWLPVCSRLPQYRPSCERRKCPQTACNELSASWYKQCLLKIANLRWRTSTPPWVSTRVVQETTRHARTCAQTYLLLAVFLTYPGGPPASSPSQAGKWSDGSLKRPGSSTRRTGGSEQPWS